MMKKLKDKKILSQKFICFLLGLSLVLSPNLALAQIEEIFSRVGNIINLALSFIIPVAVIAIIIVGYQYLTSVGNSDQMEKAKTNLLWIILGLIIIILAKGLIIFVLSSLGVHYNIFGL